MRYLLALTAILLAHHYLSKTYAREAPKPEYRGTTGAHFPRYVLVLGEGGARPELLN